MDSFLTVENVNSVRLGTVNEFYVCDTSLISTDEFNTVNYDFITIKHSINNNKHVFTFKIENEYWHGVYYFTNENGEYIDADGAYNSTKNILSLETNLNSVKLHLYLNNIAPADEFNLIRVDFFPDDLNDIFVNTYTPTQHKINFTKLIENSLSEYSFTIIHDDGMGITTSFKSTSFLFFAGEVMFRMNNPEKKHLFYWNIKSEKANPVLTLITDTFVKSKSTIIRFNYTREYGPLLSGNVTYSGATVDLEHDNTGYYCVLDLSEYDNESLELTVNIDEQDYIAPTSLKFKLKSVLKTVSTFEELKTALEDENIRELQLLETNFYFTDNLNINESVYIKGNNASFNLGTAYSIVVGEGASCRFENLQITYGNPAIIQKRNSKVELNNVNMLLCRNMNKNDLGACIYCDIDKDSLTTTDDFITVLNNCKFQNNRSNIFHGGELTIKDCLFYNTGYLLVEINNPCFLYQVDGEATIQDSIFHIRRDISNLCDNQQSLRFGQCAVKIGSTATINNANADDLSKNNALPFFENPYNNKAHVYAKYYYPKLNECVITSPQIGFEDKSVCYCVSGNDWVYKQGVQITKVNDHSENKKLPSWEE